MTATLFSRSRSRRRSEEEEEEEECEEEKLAVQWCSVVAVVAALHLHHCRLKRTWKSMTALPTLPEESSSLSHLGGMMSQSAASVPTSRRSEAPPRPSPWPRSYMSACFFNFPAVLTPHRRSACPQPRAK